MDESGLSYLIALTRLGLTSLSYMKEPLGRLGGPEAMFRADPNRLLAAGLRPSLVQAIVSGRAAAKPEEELAALRRHGIRPVLHGRADYPPLLMQIPDPPPVLYIRGELAILAAPLPLAVVGTRRMTTYGRAVATAFAGELAAAGMMIVSGLALGIDAAAHAATLAAGRPTVAVLGSGIDDDSIGPRLNLGLARRILDEGGAVVSEHPPGVTGQKHFFPLRNRIIAGMSLGTVVVEAAERSGALITGRLALEYDRDVFAVPGPITSPASAGANALLTAGAIPALGAPSILSVYGLDRPTEQANAERTPEEEKIIAALLAGRTAVDTIAVQTGLGVPAVLAALAALEIAGAVVKNGPEYALIH